MLKKKRPERKKRLTHLNARGAAHMVDVSAKSITARRAVAGAEITVAPATLKLIAAIHAPKGDVFAAARIAAILAAKRTHELIPLCHPLPIDAVEISITARPPDRIAIEAAVTVQARTGVEMEALTAAAVAALTIYDMCKAIDRGMVIGPIQLLEKTGGRSGKWTRSTRR